MGQPLLADRFSTRFSMVPLSVFWQGGARFGSGEGAVWTVRGFSKRWEAVSAGFPDGGFGQFSLNFFCWEVDLGARGVVSRVMLPDVVVTLIH